MTRRIERGAVVLTEDPYTAASGRRPFVIISDENYPFYPDGNLGVPMTRKDKPNTIEVQQRDIAEQFEAFEKDDNYVNPYSPVQVNDPGRTLCIVTDFFIEMVADGVNKAIGSP